MYLIRRAQQRDVDILLKLAKTVHFINLPADKDIISEKIRRSRMSFEAVASGAEMEIFAGDKSAVGTSPLFMFTIEDTETGNCLGTSMIVARMGGPENPGISFKLEQRNFFSRDLQQGTSHTTATLFLDDSGPTEIGGLILGPSFRRHPAKLGKQISLIRFHFIGRHREHFADTVLAEMMAPITADGRNPFWEYLGRRFINLPYDEADKFCQYSREFMTSLLPREPIYLSLLPPEARKVIGQVGKDTEPAKRMLEQLGFQFTDRIDPFDAGPYLTAPTDQIPLVNQTKMMVFEETCSSDKAQDGALISSLTEGGDFFAAYAPANFGKDGKSVRTTSEYAELLYLSPGEPIAVTPLNLHIRERLKATAAAPSG